MIHYIVCAGFDTGIFTREGGNISVRQHFRTRHWDLYCICFGLLVLFVFSIILKVFSSHNYESEARYLYNKTGGR